MWNYLLCKFMYFEAYTWQQNEIQSFFFFFNGQNPKRKLRMHCSLVAYCAHPIWYSTCYHFCRQMSLLVLQDAKSPSSERWNYIWARKSTDILPRDADFHDTIQGSFTCRKSTTCDRRLNFPFYRRRAEDFLPLKIRRLRPGLIPRTWVLKASTLPLDH